MSQQFITGLVSFACGLLFGCGVILYLYSQRRP